MTEINKIKEEIEDIISKVRGEALKNRSWKDSEKTKIDRRIKQLEDSWKELEDSYANLLESQKPDNLPVDWEEQLAKIKELETRPTAEEKFKLQKQITNLQQKLTSLKNTLPNLFNKEGEVNEELLSYELINSLEKEQLEEENNKLKERFKLLEEKAENIQLADQKTIARLQEQTSEKEEEINELKRQLQISQREAEELKENKEKSDEQINSLQIQNEKSKEQISQAKEREDELNEELQSIQRELSEKESSIKAQLEANQAQSSALQSENDRLKEELEETKVKKIEEESAIERNRKITVGLTQDNEKLRNKVAELKESISLQQSEARDVNHQEAQVVIQPPFNK